LHDVLGNALKLPSHSQIGLRDQGSLNQPGLSLGRALPTARPSGVVSRDRLTIFWQFARLDLWNAFVKHEYTRLDTTDLSIWRQAGLSVTPEGRPKPGAIEGVSDDTMCNCLTWLLLEIVNFIASGDQVPESVVAHHAGARQADLGL
jgi:hypothetical protein